MDVDITLRVRLDAPAMTQELHDALENLASVMLVQAEEGLWSLGSQGAESIDGTPSLHVADITSLELVSIAPNIL